MEDIKFKHVFYVLLFLVFGLSILAIITLPGRLLTRTISTDNVITNYEYFHDASRNFDARVAQISGHKRIVAQTTDAAELGRLRIELSAMQQSCRDLAARYNANANKVNRSIFMGSSVPTALNPISCE